MALTSPSPFLSVLLLASPLWSATALAQPADTLKTRTLDAVMVSARKSLVEQRVDKTVLNVQADVTAAGKNAYEVLQQAPGVVIDPNDNIRMAGKVGVNVYLDGKPANLSTSDLANLLKGTPASNIATVELITNPSARYDAQGNAGIINIRFRRDKSFGLTGSATGGYSQSRHGRRNVGADLTYHVRNLTVFGNANWTGGYQQTQIEIDRNIRLNPETSGLRRFEQRGFDADGWDNYTTKIGADYRIGTKQTLGVLVTGNGAVNQFGTYGITQIKNAAGRVDSSLTNRNDNPNCNNRLGSSLNYRYADTLGLDINLDADFTRFTTNNPSTVTNQYFTTSAQAFRQIGNVFDAQTGIRIVTLKGDLIKNWKVINTKAEAGFKRTDVSTDNDLRAFLTTENGPPAPDAGRTNFFDYHERVNAGYASLTRQRGNWTMQAGLRAEHSRVRGASTDLRQNTVARPDTSYVNLFPSAFVQYRAGENNQFNLNYGRRIQRPNYQDMNPFIYQIDPYTSQRGNPFLRPQYTHNLELSYTYKYATTLKISASRTNDFFTDISHQDGINAYMTVENAGRVDAVNASISSPLPITKWWSGYVYAGVTLNRYVAALTDGPLDTRAVAFDAYMQHSFTLSKAITFQISGFYNAPTQQTIFRTRGLGSLNLGIKKKVMRERGNVQLGVDDLLNTMRWSQSVNFGQQDYNLYRKWESRRVKLQLTYRFGKAKDGQSGTSIRDRETSEDASRIKTKSAN